MHAWKTLTSGYWRDVVPWALALFVLGFAAILIITHSIVIALGLAVIPTGFYLSWLWRFRDHNVFEPFVFALMITFLVAVLAASLKRALETHHMLEQMRARPTSMPSASR